MKDDKSGFWKSICADPDDDVPRLVFADYLDEQGQPERAELIRAQCDLEILPWSDPQRLDLEMTSRRLLQEHQAEWNHELPKWISQKNVQFRRGFPYAISTDFNIPTSHAQVLGHQSVVQSIRYEGNFQRVDRAMLETSGLLPRLRTIHLVHETFEGVQWHVQNLPDMRELNLSFSEINLTGHSDSVSAIAWSPALSGLTRFGVLSYGGGGIHATLEFCERLAERDLPELRSLSMLLSPETTDRESPLLNSSFARQIEELELFDSVSLSELQTVGSLTQLQSLALCLASDSEQSEAISELASLTGLARLSIQELHDQGIARLQASPLLDHLIDLEIRGDLFGYSPELSCSAILRLIESGALSNLVRLSITGRTTGQIIEEIAKTKQLPKLRHLIFPRGTQTKRDLETIVQSAGFPNLRTLSFGQSNVLTWDQLKSQYREHFHLMRP